MSRITMSLENDFEGRVLASFDLDEFANKVRADAIEEITEKIKNYYKIYKVMPTIHCFLEILEQLKEQNDNTRAD